MAELNATYQDSSIHSGWSEAYRSGRIQAAFDDAVYRWLFRVLKPGRGWLDAGCGTGQHSIRLAMLGCEVASVDISAEALDQARRNAPESASGRLHFVQSALEDLSPDILPIEVDNVHCRGVLMHVPQWRTALGNLAHCVRSGGHFVIFESNVVSIEYLIVRILRFMAKRRSRIVETNAGPEFWAEKNGNPFLVRMFDLNRLIGEMKDLGFTLERRRSLFLLDIYRIPSVLRAPVRLLNRVWFWINGPCASGVILVFRKN